MNIQSQPRRPQEKMSIDAFFRWSETQERKYEFVDGMPRLQTYVKRNHNRITVNIVMALGKLVNQALFEIATGDFAVQTGPATIRYADVMVERAGGAGEKRTAEEAVVLIEVLSDSTMHVDFGEKLREYQQLPALETYLIIAQDMRRAWQWTREESRTWPTEPLQIDEEVATIEIAAISARLTFSDIYRNVQFSI